MIRGSSHNAYNGKIFFHLSSIISYCLIFSEYEYLHVVAIIIRVYEVTLIFVSLTLLSLWLLN